MESRNIMMIVLGIMAALVSEVSGGKVKLELYYESLCPGCEEFIVDYLPKLYQTGLINITDVKLYPYGNAVVRSDGTIHCQHGKNECYLNTVEACAIDAWPEFSEHFPVIHCVENLPYEVRHTEWKSCFEKLNLEAKPVTDCLESARGKELELRYAAETDALKPPHEYVPWVVVDGQPIYEDMENFMSYICKAYKGPAPIPACSATNFIQKGRKIGPFCFTKTSSSKLSTTGSAMKLWINRVMLAASA